ncbi:MAG TPA: PAN domain-containing protein, partial [Xanthobacteraceae bacterium]|nr:PAN domain-containing protein [Xanthobacteraceae bacterium]
MWSGRLLRACLVALAFAAATATRPAQAQANFDRPGGDYQSSPVASGDPADCALVCERDRRCRAWTLSDQSDLANRAVSWLKSNVPARVQSNCCVSGVRGAGVVEPRNGAVETSIDRFGGDYKSFDLKSSEGD